MGPEDFRGSDYGDPVPVDGPDDIGSPPDWFREYYTGGCGAFEISAPRELIVCFRQSENKRPLYVRASEVESVFRDFLDHESPTSKKVTYIGLRSGAGHTVKESVDEVIRALGWVTN